MVESTFDKAESVVELNPARNPLSWIMYTTVIPTSTTADAVSQMATQLLNVGTIWDCKSGSLQKLKSQLRSG